MSFDYTFTPGETVFSNLKKISFEQSVMEEKRVCELSELAYLFAKATLELISGGMEISESFSILSDSVFGQEDDIHPHFLAENEEILKHHIGVLKSFDKIAFCRLISEKLKNADRELCEKDFLPEKATPETFVYVKNGFADEAYDVFSQEFEEPRVRYSKDFKEALSMLSNSDTGYCLLPLEDRGVRIRSVCELIFGGDFKICSVTPVFGYDGTADMKYCLVSKSFLLSDFTEDDDRYLEIRISGEADEELSELLLAAKGFNTDLYRINSVNFSYGGEERSYYSLIFRKTGKSFTDILTYLTLFTKETTTLGIYKNLE